MIQWFLGGPVQRWQWFLVHETLKYAYLKNEGMNGVDYLNANNNATVSGESDILLFDF